MSSLTWGAPALTNSCSQREMLWPQRDWRLAQPDSVHITNGSLGCCSKCLVALCLAPVPRPAGMKVTVVWHLLTLVQLCSASLCMTLGSSLPGLVLVNVASVWQHWEDELSSLKGSLSQSGSTVWLTLSPVQECRSAAVSVLRLDYSQWTVMEWGHQGNWDRT